MGKSKTLHAWLCGIVAMGSLAPKWPLLPILPHSPSLTLPDTPNISDASQKATELALVLSPCKVSAV